MKTIRLLLVFALGLVIAESGCARGEKSMVGQKLPALNLQYLRQTPDLAGKPLILEFWATWCPPCRKSIPHLNEMYAKHKDKGLIIIGVSDEEKQVVEKFLASHKMDYFPALDAKLRDTFGVTGIPHAVLVDKAGKIVWEGHPSAITDKELNLILK